MAETNQYSQDSDAISIDPEEFVASRDQQLFSVVLYVKMKVTGLMFHLLN